MLLVARSSLVLFVFTPFGVSAPEGKGLPLGTQIPTPASGGGSPGVALPLSFVENRGQWDTAARFVARRGPLVARVEPGALVVQLSHGEEEGEERGVVARIVFEGADADAELEGLGVQAGTRNYFLGDDPAGWERGVHAFDRVLYRDLYPGIDLRLREDAGRLEYDLLLAPGADVSGVAFRCDGVEGLSVDAEGWLTMETELGPIRQSPPRTWCVAASGEREALECRFQLLGDERYGFLLAEHDPGLPVVIDPGLEWATYFGGSSTDDPWDTALRSDGALVIAGTTRSLDFPTTAGAYRQTLDGASDGFVLCLDPSGSSLVWSTLIGGSGDFDEHVFDVELGETGEVYLAGSTQSSSFPVTADAFQPNNAGGAWEGFVSALSPDGSTLLYSSYLGGTFNDFGLDVEVSAPRVVTIGGNTVSADFPTTPDGVFPTFQGARDHFVTRLDLDQPPASQLVYSTYMGGSSWEGIGPGNIFDLQIFDLHLDANDLVTITGITLSADYPVTADAYNATLAGLHDCFVSRIDLSTPGPAGVLYSTYLGGSGTEGANVVTVDAAGVLCLGGFTYSDDFPTTPGAFDTTFHGPSPRNDGFVTLLDPSRAPANQLVYSSFFTGDGSQSVEDVFLEPSGRILACGFSGAYDTVAGDFPTTCGAHQTGFGGTFDGFLFYLEPGGNGLSDLLYSTYLGGIGDDGIVEIDLVPNTPAPTLVASALNLSAGDWPTTPGSFQPDPGGAEDGVALRLELNPHSYCVAAANSQSPDGAISCGSGSVRVSDNNFTVSVTGAAASQPGLFFFGPQELEVPFGDGYRCTGGGVHRLNPPGNSDANGAASRAVDFTTAPASTITAGSSWSFQYWYRDPLAGGAGFNLSNGLRVAFHP